MTHYAEIKEIYNAMVKTLNELETPYCDGNDKKAEAWIEENAESGNSCGRSGGIYTLSTRGNYVITISTDWDKGMLTVYADLKELGEEGSVITNIRDTVFWFCNPEFD